MRFLFAIALLFLAGCSQSQRVVVVYTSQDQVYAEPLFAKFEKQTGIKVLPVFDSESVKTAGLVQRLLAEKDNPRADIFWSNEDMLARRLLQNGVLDRSTWAAETGFRTRRLIVNTNHVRFADVPKSLLELTNSKWAGKFVMSYPLYGTTAAHMVGLRQKWGDEKWRQWCEGLIVNKTLIVDGNSLVVRMVGQGEAWIGLSDSDDFEAGLRNGLPISSPSYSDELLWIPNSAGIVKGAPHPSEAAVFLDFVKSAETIRALHKAKALDDSASCWQRPLFFIEHPAPTDETLEILKTIFSRR